MTTYNVVHTVGVQVNAKKFTKKFMEEFRHQFYQFDTIEEHKQHLAQLYARGISDNHTFIEGYGEAKDMGIKFTPGRIEVERA